LELIYITNLERTEIKIILLRMQIPNAESLNARCVLNMEKFRLQVLSRLKCICVYIFDKYY